MEELIKNDEEKKDLEQREYIDTIIKIIRDDLPIIAKYNIHLYQNILSAFELVLDQSRLYIQNNIQISEETKKDVDEIISEIEGK